MILQVIVLEVIMKEYFTEENKIFYKKFFAIVLPIAFSQLMMAFVSASDAIMLGAIDQDSLSAVSLAGQVQIVFSLDRKSVV